MTRMPPELHEEQLAPHSLAAEKAVLGAVLIDRGECWPDVADLMPEDFFSQSHARIFAAMQALIERGSSVDFVTLCAELEARGDLSNVDGAAYVLNLINRTPSALGAGSYAGIVQELSVRRGLLDYASRVAQLAHSEEMEIEQVIDACEVGLAEVTGRHADTVEKTSTDTHATLLDRVALLMANPGTVSGVSTGIPDFDRLYGGLQPHEVLTIQARPGMGKSTLGLQLARQAARDGHAVGFISLEMSPTELAQKQCAACSTLTLEKIKHARFDDQDYALFLRTNSELAALPIMYAFPTGGFTVLDVKRLAYKWRMRHNLRLLVVDYVQLLAPVSPHLAGGQDRRLQVDYAMRVLKQIATEQIAGRPDITVVVLGQVSRDCERRNDKRPLLGDGAESAGTEHHSDAVLILYRDGAYNPASLAPDTTEFILAKHRTGPIGRVNTRFNRAHARFEALEQKPLDDLVNDPVNADQMLLDGRDVYRGSVERETDHG